MKIIAAIIDVAALAGAIACGASDTPPATQTNEPAARPTIAGLNPIATHSDTPTPITPIPNNTPVASARQSNPTAATVKSPAPTNSTALPTATKPANAGGIVLVAEPTATPTPTPTPAPTATPAPMLTSYSAQFSQQDYDALAANLPYPPEGRRIPPPSWDEATDRHPILKDCYQYKPLFLYLNAPVVDYTADGILNSPSHQHHSSTRTPTRSPT